MSELIVIDATEENGYHSQDELLTVQNVCDLLNVKKSYVYWLTHSKKIPFIKIGGLLRFRKADIDAWLQAQEVTCVSIQAKR